MQRTAPIPTRTPSSTLRKSRSRLLAGVFTLALAGGTVGAFVLPEIVTPAQAQLTTTSRPAPSPLPTSSRRFPPLSSA